MTTHDPLAAALSTARRTIHGWRAFARRHEAQHGTDPDTWGDQAAGAFFQARDSHGYDALNALEDLLAAVETGPEAETGPTVSDAELAAILEILGRDPDRAGDPRWSVDGLADVADVVDAARTAKIGWAQGLQLWDTSTANSEDCAILLDPEPAMSLRLCTLTNPLKKFIAPPGTDPARAVAYVLDQVRGIAAPMAANLAAYRAIGATGGYIHTADNHFCLRAGWAERANPDEAGETFVAASVFGAGDMAPEHGSPQLHTAVISSTPGIIADLLAAADVHGLDPSSVVAAGLAEYDERVGDVRVDHDTVQHLAWVRQYHPDPRRFVFWEQIRLQGTTAIIEHWQAEPGTAPTVVHAEQTEPDAFGRFRLNARLLETLSSDVYGPRLRPFTVLYEIGGTNSTEGATAMSVLAEDVAAAREIAEKALRVAYTAGGLGDPQEDTSEYGVAEGFIKLHPSEDWHLFQHLGADAVFADHGTDITGD